MGKGAGDNGGRDAARTPMKLVEKEVTMGLAQHSQRSTVEDTGKTSKRTGCEGVF
jgi:hypothetical protein